MMLSDAQTWSSSTGQTMISGALTRKRCDSPPSGELTEIEKLAILVRKIAERRNQLSSPEIAFQEDMATRENERRLLNGQGPFNYPLPNGRSVKHPIFCEDSATSPIQYSRSEIGGLPTPNMNHNCLDANRMRTSFNEPAGPIHGTWPRNRRGHVENKDSTATNQRNGNLTADSIRFKSDFPSLQMEDAFSEMDNENKTSKSTSTEVTESQRPRIVEIEVKKLPPKNAINTFQGPYSIFQTRNSINSPDVIATRSCSAPKYQTTEVINADSDSLQTCRHFDLRVNVNTGLTTLTEDAGDGQENRDLNNNSVSHVYPDVTLSREDRTIDPISVSASLIITYPLVRRAHSVDNPFRRMICNPAVVSSCSSIHTPLRRTVSEESRRKGDGKTCKQGPGPLRPTCLPLNSPLVHTKPPIHRSNSCLAAFGHTCLPISKSHKVNASNHGRSWYEGV